MRILSLLYFYFMVIDSQGIVLVPAPVNVEVLSNNFIHILQWSPGNGTQPGTIYKVKVGQKRARSINGTSIDISGYMKSIDQPHKIQLWASFGNNSSSSVNMHFDPYTSTIIGPPKLTLSGCGDCLNISIDLPSRQSAYDNFYKAINFDIHWSKVTDEKDDCHKPHTYDQSKQSLPYSYVLRYLQPGERYCVLVQPVSLSIPKHNLLSSCSCEFTSRIEHRGVAFLAGWVIGSVLVGLCLLSLISSLIYTRFLCNPNVRLPKALIVYGPIYFLTPEETCISVAQVEYGIQIHKPKDHQHKKKEKGNGLYKNNDDVDEDEDEDEENHHGYMGRAVHSASKITGSRSSAPVCEVAENPGGCSFEDTPTDTKETSLLSPLQCDGVKVVLKSMQPEEEEANEPSEAKDPLLPLLLKELHEDSLTAAKPQTGSSSELHTALLLHTQTELQTSQEDEDDISDASVCDHTGTGYMASHTGTVDKQNYSSDDEEEDCTSNYMSR
ncbi:hypothetical protein AMELA_G00087430 [Ameiurus melas]|uniref:Uncharacterized protein n=1 Tax=Ameiurus melas TaxID=219545 RepID=A0A7J6AVJ2_AMEME|nr:hypothetical protein AMELA_G00087430 [Ameiurus melas]